MKIGVILSLMLVCVFPAVMLAVADPYLSFNSVDETVIEEPSTEEHEMRYVSVLTESGVLEMELEDYICCVVLAEMPAEFETEALKAQAVVARTYTCKKLAQSKHTAADVCTDASCCQAFISRDDYISDGGTQQSVQKVYEAVSKTRSQVLLYDGELIEATYFSCSGGKTEDAQAVWGTDVPYLQSVDSPGEEKATHYTDTVTVSVTDFCSAVGIAVSDLQNFGIGAIHYTNGGGVSSIELGGITFSGTRLREKLGLRSTAFVMTWMGENVTITTKGFGHRVGMSQYGAEAMAVQGSDYKTILAHYYQDTVLAFG